ncbi:MAG: hypothetical protein PHI63_01375 [Patescibacteria group bacterium]|nr:hypothetical protein [Patescibacteria group bacterium]
MQESSAVSNQPGPTWPGTLRSAFPVMIVGTLAALYAVICWYPQPNPDVGQTLTSAWQITQGLVPYRDFFEFRTPGSFYVLAGVFQWFGATYLAAKIFGTLLVLLTAFGLDRLCRLFTGSGWARVAVQIAWMGLLLQFPLISFNTYAHLASIWAGYVAVQAWRKRTPAWFAGLGAAAAGVTWMLQQRGLAFILVGLGMALAVRRWKIFFAFAAGLSIALLPFLVWPPQLLWAQLVVYPLMQYPGAAYRSLGWVMAGAAVLSVLAIVAMHAGRNRTGFWPLWWIAAASLATTWSRADWSHLALAFWAVPVLWFSCAAGFAGGSGRRQEQCRRAFRWQVALVYVFGISAGSVFVRSQWASLAADPFRLHVPFWEELAVLVQQRTAPDEPIFATPYLPQLYFFSQRPNATRHNWLMSRLDPPEYFSEVIDELESAKPRLVVRQLNDAVVALGFHRDGTVVDIYLDQHYRVAERYAYLDRPVVEFLERIAPASERQ